MSTINNSYWYNYYHTKDLNHEQVNNLNTTRHFKVIIKQNYSGYV